LAVHRDPSSKPRQTAAQLSPHCGDISPLLANRRQPSFGEKPRGWVSCRRTLETWTAKNATCRVANPTPKVSWRRAGRGRARFATSDVANRWPPIGVGQKERTEIAQIRGESRACSWPSPQQHDHRPSGKTENGALSTSAAASIDRHGQMVDRNPRTFWHLTEKNESSIDHVYALVDRRNGAIPSPPAFATALNTTLGHQPSIALLTDS